MSAKKTRKTAKSAAKAVSGIRDRWLLCGLFVLLLVLFFLPALIADNAPVSAFQLMRATPEHPIGGFPPRAETAREMVVMPILAIVGMLTALLPDAAARRALSACDALLLFGILGTVWRKQLGFAGGFALPLMMIVCAATFALALFNAFSSKS